MITNLKVVGGSGAEMFLFVREGAGVVEEIS
jgi:hypothetical protein